jgi:NDP-sugar pyrophosphorylase family protein
MVPLMKVAALVLAAGRGERLGADRPKAFVPVAGRALLVHSLVAIAAAQEIDQVIPVLGRNDARAWDELASELDSIPKLSDPVIGGAEWQYSDRLEAGMNYRSETFGLGQIIQEKRLFGSIDTTGDTESASLTPLHGVRSAIATVAKVFHHQGKHQTAFGNLVSRDLFHP